MAQVYDNPDDRPAGNVVQNPDDRPPVPPRRKNNTTTTVVIIVGVLVLLCGCLAALAIAALAWFAPRSSSGGINLGSARVEASRDFNRSFTVSGPVTLDLANNVGEVNVRAADVNQVVVRATVKAYGSSTDQADSVLNQVTTDATQNGSTVRVIGRTPSGTFQRSPQINWDIQVPRQTNIVLQNDVGKVTIDGPQGTLQATVNVGQLTVQHWTMTGDSNLRTRVGELTVEVQRDAQFNLDASTGVGKISTDFQVSNAPARPRGVNDRLQGTVGSNPTATLVLHADTGAINLPMWP